MISHLHKFNPDETRGSEKRNHIFATNVIKQIKRNPNQNLDTQVLDLISSLRRNADRN